LTEEGSRDRSRAAWTSASGKRSVTRASPSTSASQVPLVTDNGSSFTARVFQESLGRVKVFRHVPVSYRSPEPVALIERLHRTLKEEHLWPAVYEADLRARGELAG